HDSFFPFLPSSIAIFMFLFSLPIVLLLSTVSSKMERLKPYNEMEVRVVFTCHIPGRNNTTFEVHLMEANRGRDAWFNADRELAKEEKGVFNKAYDLIGMMEPELDQVLEPYLLIKHRCNLKERDLEECLVLPKHGNWTDVFPPNYHYDTGSINVDELDTC
ncbi:hypothetical protein PENTCL1PPCAC_22330, partial [Pristionchus entomophagus]